MKLSSFVVGGLLLAATSANPLNDEPQTHQPSKSSLYHVDTARSPFREGYEWGTWGGTIASGLFTNAVLSQPHGELNAPVIAYALKSGLVGGTVAGITKVGYEMTKQVAKNVKTKITHMYHQPPQTYAEVASHLPDPWVAIKTNLKIGWGATLGGVQGGVLGIGAAYVAQKLPSLKPRPQNRGR